MIARNEEIARWIPIDQIHVVNPRARGKNKFRQIVANIGKLGLKRPITVANRPPKEGIARYDLVCGQGRLEAAKSLGWSHVPAIVIEAGNEDLLLMSLVENLARRRQVGLELAKEIGAMKDRGHDLQEIARMTDLEVGYVRGVSPYANRQPHPAPQAGQTLTMTIKELGNFEYDPDKGGNIPDDVKRLSGAKIRLTGFMIPANQAEHITQFALVPSLFSCCYGQPPQVQHTIVCNCPKGKAIGYSPDPIVVEGTLQVKEERDDGYVTSIFQVIPTSISEAPKDTKP